MMQMILLMILAYLEHLLMRPLVMIQPPSAYRVFLLYQNTP
jgi:hypothetical protein